MSPWLKSCKVSPISGSPRLPSGSGKEATASCKCTPRARYAILTPYKYWRGVSGATDLPLSCPHALIVRQTSFPRSVGDLYSLKGDMRSQWQGPHDIHLFHCKPLATTAGLS